MSLKKVYMIVGIVLALAGLAALTWYSREKNNWPQFPETTNNQPALVVEVEPDFAYRTGDIVPVVVYLKAQPGTSIDIASLALEGAFEIRGELGLSERKMPDGSTAYRIEMELQSLQVLRKLQTNISVVWMVDGEKETRELRQKLLEVYTSLTWDGRKEIKDGPLAPRTGGHWWLTVGILVVSLGGFIWAVWYLKNAEEVKETIRKHYEASPRTKLKRRVDKAWARIAAGDLDRANFEEINNAMREFFELESVLLANVRYAVGNHPQVKQIHGILSRCQWAMYAPGTFPKKELVKLRDYLDEVVDRKKPQPQVIETAVKAS